MDNAPGVRFVSLTFLVGFGFGAFIGVALALVAVAISRPEDEEPRLIEIAPIPTATLLPEETPLPPAVRATAAVAVRVGPGDEYATLGTVSRGDGLDVVGRDFDSEWLAIRFPAGSDAQGWIPAATVEGITFSNLQALAVLLPTPLPLEFTTPPAFFGTPGTRGTPEEGTPGIGEGTPGPLAGTMDLAVFDVSALADGRVRVVVLNGGPADLTDGILAVAVRTLSASAETLYFTDILAAGNTVVLTTSSSIVGDDPIDILVIIDPSSNLRDPNRANNVITTPLSRATAVVPTVQSPGPG
ncbi:MAG TPA: hypothetical protein VFS30_07240 [Dehalococcoidia bacterium]|nr:hypothetical protein [Dehalococcoidia bacterium]